jgi:hypothetical protein
VEPTHLSTCERVLARPAVAALVCLLLTVLLTWPLAARLDSALPAGAGDLWQNLWNFWWWDRALREGLSPWWTPYLFHPGGADLAFHTHSPLNMLLFARWLEPETAYGAAVLVSSWLSAFGAYLLARELTGSARAGLVAGLVFAFFPHRMEQTLEHLNLFSTQFLPLTLWAFFAHARRGGGGLVLALGACFAANALCDWQLAIQLTGLLALLALVAWLRPVRPRAALARDWALAGALAVLLTLPAAWPLLRGIQEGAPYQKPAVEKGADLAFLLRPHFHHPLWGELTREAYLERRGYASAGFVSYLGVVPLALAGLAVARRRAGGVLWAGIFLGSLLLALGAHPRVEGRLLEEVTLPFAWLRELPVLGTLRVANRFLTPAGLALAVLAAHGFVALARRSDARFALVLGLVALDYLWLPYPLRERDASPLLARLREAGPPGAVIDIPFTVGPAAGSDMVAQTVHGRPIAGGYPSVPSPAILAALEREPALADLQGIQPKLARPVDRERLVALGFGVVLLHKDRRAGGPPPSNEPSLLGRGLSQMGEMEPAHFDGARRRVEAACGEPFYEDERVAAFRLALPPRDR